MSGPCDSCAKLGLPTRSVCELCQSQELMLARANGGQDGYARAVAEIEMLRGVGCNEDSDGPCGVCLKCKRDEGYKQGQEDERMRLIEIAEGCALFEADEFSIVEFLNRARARGEKKEYECDHAKHKPTFDLEAAKGLDYIEIRKRWPRFFGVCSQCGANVILYASSAHFVYGDW